MHIFDPLTQALTPKDMVFKNKCDTVMSWWQDFIMGIHLHLQPTEGFP